MSEVKKKVITLELTDEDTKAFIEKCCKDGTTPDKVVEGFIKDLVGSAGTSEKGKSELAGQYYESCGYGSIAPGEYRSFTQWLLDKNGIQDVTEAMEDLGKAFNKLIMLNSRNIGDTDERKEVETFIIGCYQRIDVHYKEYQAQTTDADEDDEALNGVREYLETLNKALKEGVL